MKIWLHSYKQLTTGKGYLACNAHVFLLVTLLQNWLGFTSDVTELIREYFKEDLPATVLKCHSLANHRFFFCDPLYLLSKEVPVYRV